MEYTTTTVAAGAVATPIWLPWLTSASEVAAVVAPILGVVWLTVQIISKVRDIFFKGTKRED